MLRIPKDPVLAAMVERPVICGHHSKILRDPQLRKLSRAIGRRSVAGVRARHGQGAGRAAAVEAAHESCRDALDRCVRPPHVPPPVHERSHENARLRLLRIAWQVMLYSQRLRR